MVLVDSRITRCVVLALGVAAFRGLQAQGAITNPPPIVQLGCEATAWSRGLAFRAAVESAQSGTTVLLGPCTYELGPRPGGTSAVWLRGDRITIRGTGRASRLLLRRNVGVGLEIKGPARGLTVRDLRIEGLIFAVATDGTIGLPHTQGIGSYSGESGIEDVTIARVEVANVTIGISVGSPVGSRCVRGSYQGAVVMDNYVHDVHGLVPGTGYGIHSECAERAILRGNVLARVDRHSIYQARTSPRPERPANDVLVVGNVIVNHSPVWRCDGTRRGALVVARSSNVAVVANTVIQPYQESFTVEWDGPGASSENVSLIANRILRSGDGSPPAGCGADIWVNVPRAQVVLWRNYVNGSGGGSRRQASIEVTAGGVGVPARWRNVRGMEELDGWLYVLDGDSLWRVWPSYGTDPDTWAAAPMPLPAMAGRRIEALAAGGGDLYFVANGIFHRLVSGSGVIASRASAWQAADALLAVAGVVYVSVNGWLHRVQPGGDGVTWQSIPQKLAGMRAHALGMAEGILYVRARSSRRFLSRYGHSLSEVQ